VTKDRQYAELVSVACHDILTPLATVYGFARTLERADLEPPSDRYVDMIGAASSQIDELVDQLRLATRIQLGLYQPALVETDSLELARSAADRLEDGRVEVTGEGAAVLVDREPTVRALAQLARAAARFVLGEELRELPAPAAAMLVRALGGTLEARDETLWIRLPAGS
jgi:signal transduction histidine kinase